MKYTIYQITNVINGKIYIGKHQTNNINDGYMGSGKNLKRAIKKYGIDNFVKDILYVFDSEEKMNYKEAELVTEEFCLREDTYNICVGGKGGFSYINNNGMNNENKNKQEVYEKISSSLTGRKNLKCSIAMKNQYRSGERVCLLKPYYGNTHNKKPIKRVIDGKIYQSVNDAALDRKCSASHINKLRKKGHYEYLS